MNTKKCTGCGQYKATEDFPFKSKKQNKRNTRCRSCLSNYQKSHYISNRASYIVRSQKQSAKRRSEYRRKLIDYFLDHPCVDCGEADPVCLEFDHVRGKKTKDVSRMIGNQYSWESIQREIALCEVRCANCHRKRTAKQFGYYTYLA